MTGKGDMTVSEAAKVSSEVAAEIDFMDDIGLDLKTTLKKSSLNHILIKMYNSHSKFSPGNRKEFFLASILNYLSEKHLASPYSKALLIEDINSYTIKRPVDFEFDRKNLLSAIDELSEQECLYLIKHIDLAVEVNKNFIDSLTNFVEEKRKSLLKLVS
jgi:hypothetical protein